MANILPVNAVVSRFAPASASGTLTRPMPANRQPGHFRVSVFASPPIPNESEDSVIDRLLAASELGGISATNNEKYYLCASAGDVERLGFEFVKDGHDGELTEHFSIDFGREPTLEDAQELSDTFCYTEEDLMTVVVTIDPNVRVNGDQTYAAFEDVRGGNAHINDHVLVHVDETDLVGNGIVSSLDWESRLVYLEVDWSSIQPTTGNGIALPDDLPAMHPDRRAFPDDDVK